MFWWYRGDMQFYLIGQKQVELIMLVDIASIEAR